MQRRNTHIQRKLIAIILIISGVVSLLTCASFLAYEYISFKQDTLQRLTTLAHIVGDNSTAALVFEDHENAVEILGALSAEEHITAASLYDRNGTLFATYPEVLDASTIPSAPGATGFLFDSRMLSGFQPVVQADQMVGTIYLRCDLGELYDRLQVYSILVLIVMFSTFLVAYLLSQTLQKRVSNPILALADIASSVSVRGDYSVRAIKSSDDEIGQLTDAFNKMLARIQEQDEGLRESEERLRLMVSNVRDYSIIMLDPDGNITTWNNGAESLEGYSSNEILGSHFSVLLPEADVACGEAKRIIESARSQGSIEFEGWRIRRNGSTYYANVTLTAVHDDSGNLRGFCKITRDLTERRQAEEEVRQLNAELEERVRDRTAELMATNKELEAFCYSVSHDLRAPLRSIHGFSTALSEDAGHLLGDTDRDHLERICAASKRMGDLIDSLLALSRLTRDALTIEEVDLSAMANSVVNELVELAPERTVDWEIAGGLVVRADRRLLRAAITNLLGNAWKYSGKVTNAKISLGEIKSSGAAVFFVKDNGAGFDMAYSNKLFGAFQRLHSVREFEGNGIGLATVQRIITKHGGRVWAEAAVDNGATFYFTLGGQLGREISNAREDNLIGGR